MPLATIVVVVSSVPAADVLARLAADERQWIIDLRPALQSRFGDRLRDLRLFGSKVRGDDHDESDIDILVLLDGCTQEDRNVVWDLAWSISTVLMPVVSDFETYHAPRSRASGFYEEMRKESVRL
jgi:predicted nucleotidyltransferase